MKQTHPLFFLVIIIFALSCGKESALTEKMNAIKTMGDDNPQLAMLMLDSLNATVRNESSHVLMKYDLLKLRLQDKAYIMATSDVVAKQLIDYYDRHGSVAEKQEAYYYVGSVYRDLQDTPRALEYFLKSLELAETHSDCDSVLLRNTYSNLCYLYDRVQDYQHELKMAKKLYAYSVSIGVTNIVDLLQISISYANLDSIEQASKYAVMALDTMTTTPQLYSDMESLCNLLINFSCFKDSIHAAKCHDLIEQLDSTAYNDVRFETYCKDSGKDAAYAMYYELMGLSDSAICCYRQILQDEPDLFRMYDASKALFHIYQKKGNMEEANRYADLYIKISDSIDLGKRQELAATVNNEFQYHLDKNEELRVMEENGRFRFLLAVSCIVGVSILFLAFLMMAYRRNRHLKELLAISNERNMLIDDKIRLQQDICQRETELKEKERQLSEKVQQNQTFLNLLHQSELEGKAEDVIYAVRQSSEGRKRMQPADWRQLYRAVDELYPSFKDLLLRNLGTFTEQQMQVCYLMRIGLSKPQIQHMTDLSRVTVWRWVKKFNWVQGGDAYLI